MSKIKGDPLSHISKTNDSKKWQQQMMGLFDDLVRDPNDTQKGTTSNNSIEDCRAPFEESFDSAENEEIQSETADFVSAYTKQTKRRQNKGPTTTPSGNTIASILSDSDSETDTQLKKHYKKAAKTNNLTIKSLKKRTEGAQHHYTKTVAIAAQSSSNQNGGDVLQNPTTGNAIIANNGGDDQDTTEWNNKMSQEEYKKHIEQSKLAIVKKTSKLKKKKTSDKQTIQFNEDKINPLPLQKFHYALSDARESQIQSTVASLADGGNIMETFQTFLQNPNRTFFQDASLMHSFLRQHVPKSLIPTNRIMLRDQMIRRLGFVTREEEESYLRTPYKGERPCCRDDKCEGRFIPGARKVTLTEMLTASEILARDQGKGLPKERKMCVMCRRSQAEAHWITTRSESASINGNWCLQDYYNLVDVEGEYILEQCFMSSSREYQGNPLPILYHTRYWYTQEVKDDAVYYLQTGYLKPGQVTTTPVF
jgi:hypothetical protein